MSGLVRHKNLKTNLAACVPLLKQSMEFKELKKKLGITQKDVARWMGFKNMVAFYRSPKKQTRLNGIVEFYQICQNHFSKAEKQRIQNAKEIRKADSDQHAREIILKEIGTLNVFVNKFQTNEGQLWRVHPVVNTLGHFVFILIEN